jgi:hypothetical protein
MTDFTIRELDDVPDAFGSRCQQSGQRRTPMLCALTVRTLKPGTFEEFRVALTSFDDADNPPPG